MSFRSELMRRALLLLNGRSIAARTLLKPPRHTRTLAIHTFDKRLRTTVFQVDGFDVITAEVNHTPDKHIIFLHGGAYTLEALTQHRRIIECWCLEHALRVTFIDYPLAPEYQFEKSHEVVRAAYKAIVSQYPENEFYLFGDSSGGGFALALLQQLKNENHLPFPRKTALVSPWLDMSLSNPGIEGLEKTDPILSRQALLKAGRLYAGDVDLRNPVLSPIYGTTDDLGAILLLFGTHEIFYPDCLLLKSKLESSQGSTAEVYIWDKMLHDWILLPVPEARQTIRQIGRWYSNTRTNSNNQ